MPIIEVSIEKGQKAIDWVEQHQYSPYRNSKFVDHDGSFQDYNFMLEDEPIMIRKVIGPNPLAEAKTLGDIPYVYRIYCSKSHLPLLEQAGFIEAEGAKNA